MGERMSENSRRVETIDWPHGSYELLHSQRPKGAKGPIRRYTCIMLESIYPSEVLTFPSSCRFSSNRIRSELSTSNERL